MLQIHENANPPAFALFQFGFRPFFSAAALFAIFSMVMWMLIYDAGIAMPNENLPAMLWHAHEMIFGYGMAVIAGFLMTAVSNWTGLITWKGGKLILLTICWLIARISLLLPGNQLLLAAVFDTMFLTGFLISISIPVVQSRMWKQTGILSKVVLMLLANLIFYAGALGFLEQGIHIGLYGGLYMILALLFVMIRRVVPFFIEKGLNNSFIPVNRTWLDVASIVLFIIWVMFDLFINADNLLALASVLLFILHTIRLKDWYTSAIFKVPLLWSLYIGYAALTLGFLIKTLSIWGDIAPSLATHTFAVGGVGIMTLAMMSRVTLGHTGRDVFNPPKMVIPIFLLIIAASISRVFLPILNADLYLIWIGTSQVLWIVAFTIFSFVFIPQLIKPRIDNRPG